MDCSVTCSLLGPKRRRAHFILWTLLYHEIVCIQYTPVEIGDVTNCALILANDAQYSSDLLKSDFGGPVNCITYDAINQAYLEARKRIDVPTAEKDNWTSEEVAAVGQLLLDISQQIAREYSLSPEDIESGLSKVNAMRSLISNVCPAYLSSISCKVGRYRRHDGLCNNANQPTWGATMTPFTRLLQPQFADYLSSPRISSTGNVLPPARIVSRTVHVDEGYHDHAGTVMMVAWGQFMDHDFTLMGTPADFVTRNEPEECCYRPEHLKNPYCMEITIPEDDYFYRKFNVRCQDFVRAFPGVRPNCRLGSRNPFNTLTSVIDGNTVYGVTDTFARQLRTGSGGLLRMNSVFSEYGLKDLLPLKTKIPDEGCTRTNNSQFCFLAGEIRVNEQLALTCIHTLMAREHNRIAEELAVINPQWDDETLYQEARRITIAEIQHITFNEFFPLVLGKEVMEKYGLTLTAEGYWDGYNHQVNPNILDAFSAAAFRFGHSLLPSALERWSKLHKFIASKRLSELIRRPYDLYRAGVIDEYLTGLTNQVAQAMDESVTQEVTNHLLKKPGQHFGLDLISFNVQRGRDFGIPGYMHYRKYCGLETADTFVEMFGHMPNSTVYRYMSIYESPWDIDLWSGGVSEKPLPGSMVGPTFACIIATQMNLIRRGDRFWYELPDQPSSFSPGQLKEIRKVKLSRLLCDNTDLIDTIQIYPMVLTDHDINPRVPCRSSVIPRMDLSLWVETSAKFFADNVPVKTTYSKNTVADTNNTAAPSAYEYHIKTIAVIEGSSQPVNVNSLLTSNLGNAPLHKLSKREANTTTTEDPKIAPVANKTETKDPLTSPSQARANVTQTSRNVNTTRDINKRHSPSDKQRKQRSKDMTQAIIKEDPAESGVRRKMYFVDDEQDIDHLFRKNVNIYDGVPDALSAGYRSHDYDNTRNFNKEGTDDHEDEDEPMKGLLEVSPEHDSEYEFVPMTVDEFGKQKVIEPYSNEEDDYPKPYSYNSEEDTYDGPYRRPHSHDSGPSSYKTYEPDHSSFFSSSPPKYGTSHQYNSLSDDQPRYYKHFVPSIRGQQSTSSFDDDDENHPHSYHDNDDFPPPHSSKYSNYERPSYERYPPPRTTHVPRTLEEYHRIHKTFENSRSRPRFRKPIIVPQGDKGGEEDEEEKEKDEDDLSDGPKSFVSLNFRSPGASSEDDEGFAIRHQIGHTRSRFRPTYSSVGSGERHDGSGFNSDFYRKRPTGFHDSSDSIKSYVDSVFNRNRNSFPGRKKAPTASPFNPHYGERVVHRGRPSQNVLWHRRAAESRDAPLSFPNRDKAPTRNKNDRHVHEENARFFDNLVRDLEFKPAKRDIDDKEVGVEGAEPEADTEDENIDEGDGEPHTASQEQDDENQDEGGASKESHWSEPYPETS